MPTLATALRKSNKGRTLRVRAAQTATYPTTAEIVGHHDTHDNFALDYTIASVQSGDWSNPATWNPARVPEQGDIVAIKTTHVVTYDVESLDLIAAIGVAGTFRWQHDIDTYLGVQNLTVFGPNTLGAGNYGYLEIGTAAQPIQADQTATIVIGNSVLVDENTGGVTNKEYSNGVQGWGKVRIHGAIKTPFVLCDDELVATQTTITLDSAVSGWVANDTLLLPDTRGHLGLASTLPYRIETRTLASVAGNGLSVTVPGLTYDHQGARDKDGVLDFTPEVANLTRNVIIRSEDPDGIRGHTQFFDRCDVDIRYASFQGLGRTINASVPNTTTNQKGRYPGHFHKVLGPGDGTEGAGGIGYDASVDPDEFKPGDAANIASCNGPTLRFIGNVIWDTSDDGDVKWPLTTHGTCDALIRGNVVYRGTGSLMMFEEGSEVRNVIDGNFLCHCYDGTGDRGDGGFADGNPGREGNGMSMPNLYNFVRNNRAYNMEGVSIGYHTYGGTSSSGGGFADGNELLQIAAWQGADPEEDFTTGHNYPVLQWQDNHAICCDVGFVPWYTGCHINQTFTGNIAQSVLLRMHIWHCRIAVYRFPTNNFTYRDCIWRADFAHLGFGLNRVGLSAQDYYQRNEVLDNCNIQGFDYGVYVPNKVGVRVDGDPGDSEGIWTIQDSILCNFHNVNSGTMEAVSGGGVSLTARRANITNCQFFQPTGHTGGKKFLKLSWSDPPGSVANWIQLDRYYFSDIDGEAGDDVRVYWTESAGTFVTPQTTGSSIGSPEAGQTNTANLAEHGVCCAGAISPTAATRAGFDGFVEDL
jgi:hypothetical protein